MNKRYFHAIILAVILSASLAVPSFAGTITRFVDDPNEYWGGTITQAGAGDLDDTITEANHCFEVKI
jgi:hypothetical protein